MLVVKATKLIDSLDKSRFFGRVGLFQSVATPCDFTARLPIEALVDRAVLAVRDQLRQSSETVP